MRKIRTLFILALATVAVVWAAFYVLQRDTGERIAEKAPLFPALGSQLNQAAELRIGKGEFSFTLRRQGENSWRIQERADYPADLPKIHELLLGSANLQRLEEKTRNPERYSQLGLAETGEKDDADKVAMQIAIRDDKDQLLADFFVGKRTVAKSRRSRHEMYVRTRDDPTVWLVEGNLPHGDKVTHWLQKDILQLDHEHIQAVRITHADGETVTIRKNDRDAFDYYIVGLPETAKPRSTHIVNGIAIGMADIELLDVQKEQNAALSDKAPGATVLITTFDGMLITMTTWRSGENILARLAADFDPEWDREPKPRKGEKKAAPTTLSDHGSIGNIGIKAASDVGKAGDIGIRTGSGAGNMVTRTIDLKGRRNADFIKKEAAELAERWRDWIYILPGYRMDKLTKRMSDLVK
ncbi:MAG: DUF4340 domain-containing protein [Gammaproteobacteria bacterium]|nr:DUF4340 domain-containing protein [Gammaproteobacteria bacterium]NNJ84214.1 DUF4340 domain-containing protein [Gammaproteobacteria bacterium]